MQDELIKQGAKMELAKRNFFDYANLMAGDFYKRDRKFLVHLCDELQDFYYSRDDLLVINLPP